MISPSVFKREMNPITCKKCIKQVEKHNSSTYTSLDFLCTLIITSYFNTSQTEMYEIDIQIKSLKDITALLITIMMLKSWWHYEYPPLVITVITTETRVAQSASSKLHTCIHIHTHTYSRKLDSPEREKKKDIPSNKFPVPHVLYPNEPTHPARTHINPRG